MASLRPLYVLGTSGLAKEMAQLVHAVNHVRPQWIFEGFVGDATAERGRDLGWGPIVGDVDWLLERGEPADLLVGIGYPVMRARVVERYCLPGSPFEFPNVIHPRSVVDETRVRFGKGNTVTAGCVFTCDITIGDFNLFNLNTTVGHDAIVGNLCVFNPTVNLSGGVQIGDRVLVGTGAQILEGLTVASDATVGAGGVVTRDVAHGITVVGVPARPLIRG